MNSHCIISKLMWVELQVQWWLWGQFLFSEIINSHWYVIHILAQFFEHLSICKEPVSKIQRITWLQHGKQFHVLFTEGFLVKVTCREHSPSRSLGMNPCDFNLWGMLKINVVSEDSPAFLVENSKLLMLS